MKRLIFIIAALSGLGGPTMADVGEANRSITLRGYVPLVCRAEYVPAIAFQTDGVVALGSVREFCNAGRGYRVVVEFTPTEDPGSLILNGEEVALDQSGSMVVAEVGGPSILSRDLAYRPGTKPITALRVRLQADFV